MHAHLITDGGGSSENAEARTILEDNDIPFVSAYVDVPEPELVVVHQTYYGIEQIRESLEVIKEQFPS